MSEFSDFFKRLIQEKNINVYSMVQYCNTDRSTMYKFINGKRKLRDLSLFQKISEFMRLSPQEYQEFLKSYHISNIGEYTYYCRKHVESFILNFPDNIIPSKPPKDSYRPMPEYPKKSQCFSLNTQMEINNYLYWMIHQETSVQGGRLGLLLQPDYDFLFHLLSSIKPSQVPIKIEHIFCLNTSDQITDSKKLRILLYLKKIMPLFFAGLDYQPHYFYDDINAHFYNLHTFPCLVLTSSCALMCSSNFKQGILYSDQELLDFFWKTFEDIRKETSPLFQVVDSVLDECNNLGNMGWGLTPSYEIQAEPCLVPYITPAILERMVYQQIPGRSSLLENINNFIAVSRARIPNPNMHMFHTLQGIRRFLETGRLLEIPEDIYSPFTMEERLQMLQDMIPYMDSGTYHILKGHLENIPPNLHLGFTRYNGYLLFRNNAGKNVYLIIEESSILSAFMDYASNFDENDFYGPEESVSYIQKLIEKYKNDFTPPYLVICTYSLILCAFSAQNMRLFPKAYFSS